MVGPLPALQLRGGWLCAYLILVLVSGEMLLDLRCSLSVQPGQVEHPLTRVIVESCDLERVSSPRGYQGFMSLAGLQTPLYSGPEFSPQGFPLEIPHFR